MQTVAGGTLAPCPLLPAWNVAHWHFDEQTNSDMSTSGKNVDFLLYLAEEFMFITRRRLNKKVKTILPTHSKGRPVN
jgi:hypothetical protein